MRPWIFAAIAILTLVGAVVAHGAAQAVLTKRHFRRVFQGRVAEAAFESCRNEFPHVDSSRVALAYKWVQQLVPFAESAPIEASDDLWENLRIDQGNADDQFESAHEWRGDGQKGASPAQGLPPCTVRDLMAEVLAYGYEGYAAVPSRRAAKHVA